MYSILLWCKFFEPLKNPNLATLRVSADPWALNGPRGLFKCPQIMKSIMMTCMRGTLLHFNLHHMDFPDGPAAIHWSRTTYSKPTKAASPNELINPKKYTINRPNPTHSFLGYWPAVFPGWVISSHACIVVLSETSSSSHFFKICNEYPWASGITPEHSEWLLDIA